VDFVQRGAIRNQRAYERGKNLDHSEWQLGEDKLPRLITPSDIDMVFSSRGRVAFCEISSSARFWADLEIGQRRTYQDAIRNAEHVAVLCTHNVPLFEARPIKSASDIVGFQVMVHYAGTFRVVPVVNSNATWRRFIRRWCADAEDTFHTCAFWAEPMIKRAAEEAAP
jgi:hypothetical protein